jgi:valyl-tRNA synthetase
VWQRNKEIGAVGIMTPAGTLNDTVPEKYRGLKMHTKAREAVVADLVELGLHDPETDREDREIDLAHSDRSKTPIEPYLADQWFVKMSDNDGKPGLAQMAMNAVSESRVEVTPPRYAKSYLDWLGEKRDWCIGRQLWWGHRIPVWTRPKWEGEDYTDASVRAYFRKWVIAPACGDDEARISDAMDEFACAYTADHLHICFKNPAFVDTIRETLTKMGYMEDPDVLDTWFSSGLWPHSTLGWPGPALPDKPKSPANPDWSEQKYYYPTSMLITSRDIITLWVARMVLSGLYNLGEIPFHDVYIHPKILDGYGETMSKTKGNGVDPLDIIGKFGTDALRFGLAEMATETQDVRMPVEFECPHCQKLMEQTQKNRTQPRIDCKHCGKPFSTQWANKPEDVSLPRGLVVSERFEKARNFCNKLWNAARFALMNLEGYSEGSGFRVQGSELPVEDQWILSRLSTVTTQATTALEQFKFADAARLLYDFAWDEFCSFYLEMSKSRLQDPATRPAAQRILAHTLDTILRLLHPMTPFICEDVWQRLNAAAPQRGLAKPQPAAESVMIAPWPEADKTLINEEIEARFARFQQVLAGLREVRARQGIAPKAMVRFAARCDAESAALLEPMRPYFESMAGATLTEIGSAIKAPPLSAHFTAAGLEAFVDLAEHIDVDAEKTRKEKELQKFDQLIAAKEKQLSNEAFVSRAPEAVIAKERAALEELKDARASTRAMLEQLVSIR